MNRPDSTSKTMPNNAELKLLSCGLEVADFRKNCDCGIAELRLRSNMSLKSFLQVAELRLRTQKKVARAHLWQLHSTSSHCIFTLPLVHVFECLLITQSLVITHLLRHYPYPSTLFSSFYSFTTAVRTVLSLYLIVKVFKYFCICSTMIHYRYIYNVITNIHTTQNSTMYSHLVLYTLYIHYMYSIFKVSYELLPARKSQFLFFYFNKCFYNCSAVKRCTSTLSLPISTQP